MPVVADSPRSAGGASRGGRIATAPRSATASAPRGAATRTTAEAIVAANRGRTSSADSGRPGLTPVRVLLDAASAPFYAVGNLASGDPRNAGINLLTLGQRGRKTFVSDAPIVARGIRQIPGPSWLRTGASFTVDVAADPLTYLSFGVGPVIKGARGAAAAAARKRAAEELAEATSRAAARGRHAPSPRELAEIRMRAAAAIRESPQSLKVYLRTPLSRNRGRLIGESERARSAVTAAVRPVRDSTVGIATRRTFRADRGTDPVAHEGRLATRAWEEATLTHFRKRMDAERAFARRQGVDEQRITRHLDQPEVYLPRNPAEAEVYARMARLRDDIEQIARDAGIEMGFVRSYIMHMPRNNAARKAFERMFPGRRAENQGYTKSRVLQTLDDWEDLGLEPMLDPWVLIDTRLKQGVTDAAVKGYKDAIASVRGGVKPPPLRPVDVGGQAIRVSNLESDLARSMEKVDVAPAKRAVKQARAEVKAARKAVEVAREQGDAAAVARAERALQAAEEAASQAAILARQARSGDGSVGDVVAEGLDEARGFARSRGATGARLPEPAAGRYRLTIDDRKAASRVRSAATRLRTEAKKVRASFEVSLRDRTRDRVAALDAEAKGARRGVGKTGVKNLGNNPDGTRKGGPQTYVYNFRDDARQTTGRGGKRRRKTVAEFENDYLEELAAAAARGVELDEVERAILRGSEQYDDLIRQAEEMEYAVRQARGGEFGELDPAAGAARLREVAASLPARTVDMRARRKRGAARHGQQETPPVARNAGPDGPTKGTRRAARARFRRYFTGVGPLSEAIDAVKLGVEQEVKAATRAAQREVAKAQRRLERARTTKDTEAIRWAQKMLRDAQRTERQVAADLARAKATYGGNPRQIAAKVRELVKQQRILRIMEQRARKVAEHNRELAARPGREVDIEEYRALMAEGWQQHTSKYHKGTLLDPDTHEAVRKVDAEVGRLISRDEDVAAVARFFNQIGSAWKGLQLATPRYHMRNVLDDGIADWLAGARNPQSYVQAARIMRGTQQGTIKTRAGTFTPEQILQMAESQGVLHMGFAAWEVGKQQEGSMRTLARGKVRMPGSGRVVRTSRHIGELREDWSRLGLFIEMLKKGEDAVQAGMTVRRYRYDYSDLSPFLMNARAVAIPFLTFTWKTIPMLGKQVAERPGAFSKTNIIVEYLQEAGGDPDRSLLAPWETDAFGVPAPGALTSFFGAEEGEPVFYNPRIALRYADAEMLNPAPDAIVRNWGGMVGPIKAPVELLTGFSTFQNRQLRDGERVRMPGPVALAERLGVPIPGSGPKSDSYSGEVVPGYSARLHQFLSTIPPFQHAGNVAPGGGNTDWERRLAQFLTGFNLRPEDRARSAFYAERFGR